MNEYKDVVIGVLKRGNQYCLSQRKKTQSFADKWEFPGGKLEDQESLQAGLIREFEEEVGIKTTHWQPLITIPWHYDSVSVRLNVFITEDFTGEPTSKEGQKVAWFELEDLLGLDFPEANQGILTAMQLSDFYLLTSKNKSVNENLTAIHSALAKKVRTLQLVLPKSLTEQEIEAVQRFLNNAKEQKLTVLLSGFLGHYFNFDGFAGVHLSASDLNDIDAIESNIQILSQIKSMNKLLAVSVHEGSQIKHAELIGASVLLISPVKKSTAHPDLNSLGWQKFAELVSPLAIPVYALGGMQQHDLVTAKSHGARGVASKNFH